MEKKTAMIAMSGGVDSSVAAYLMQQEGYSCAGVTMQMCTAALLGGKVPADNVNDARQVAQKLGMDFFICDGTEDFVRQVVAPFIRCYEEGGTPNPCIRCNNTIKFGALLDFALEKGRQLLVTGHYARLRQDPDTGRWLLRKAKDEAKDQTYFLAGLTQAQLSHARFPLGEFTKDEIREIALAQGFLNARKRDSQDICFIPDGDFAAFIRRYTGKDYPAGDYLDMTGKVVGRHWGAFCYTIGQRKGLGIALGAPAYVVDKDMAANTVTVGPNEALFRDTLEASNWNWLPFPTLESPMEVMAKVRYRHIPQPATVYPLANGNARVVFKEPQRAITKGQAVVLYQDDTVIGSGTIERIL